MEYYSKYLRYKKKYIELKNNIIGGAFPFAYGYGTTFYIMAKISGETYDRVKERRQKLQGKQKLKAGISVESDLHITLLQLYINLAHPLHNIFYNTNFIDAIADAYKKNIKSQNVSLSSVKLDSSGNVLGGNWDFFGMGDFPRKYWARVYDLPQKYEANIKQFRMDIYNYINSKFGIIQLKTEYRGIGNDITNFAIYGTSDGNELYAIVVDHYFGVKKWKPHISVIRMDELITQEVDKLNKMNLNDASDDIRRTIGYVNPMSNIDFNRDVKTLKIALNQPHGLKVGLPNTEFIKYV